MQSLAYAIEHMDGMQGCDFLPLPSTSGQWLIIPAFSQDATFLTPAEKQLLLTRLRHDRGTEKTNLKDVDWMHVLF